MPEARKYVTSPFNRIVEFMVLNGAFFTSCILLSIEYRTDLFLQMIVYATVLLLTIRACKRVIVSYDKNVGEATRQIAGNAAGIFVGTCLVLVSEKLLYTNSEFTVAIIFSSVMAFFILGTLSPIVHKTSIAHKKLSSF